MTIPDKPGEKQDIEIPVLDERLFNSPAVAIQQAKSAVETMARNARANYAEAMPVLYSHNTETLQSHPAARKRHRQAGGQYQQLSGKGHRP